MTHLNSSHYNTHIFNHPKFSLYMFLQIIRGAGSGKENVTIILLHDGTLTYYCGPRLKTEICVVVRGVAKDIDACGASIASHCMYFCLSHPGFCSTHESRVKVNSTLSQLNRGSECQAKISESLAESELSSVGFHSRAESP